MHKSTRHFNPSALYRWYLCLSLTLALQSRVFNNSWGERTAELRMIECIRFRRSLLSPLLSLQLCPRTSEPVHTTESATRWGTQRRRGPERKMRGSKHSACADSTEPTREAHRASVSSLQLRALIRLIVFNIETHNKHNTWRPFAILISPSQPARTNQQQPSGISLIWLQNNDTIIAMATLRLHPMSGSAGIFTQKASED